MSNRKIQTLENPAGDKCIIYFDSDYQEYIVKFFVAVDGALIHFNESDYFTDHKADALATARHTLKI